MAEVLVATKLAEAVLSQVVERIAELLIHEAASLRGVGNDVENLQSELKWMKSFLKDADRKQEHDERVRLWITEVRDVASEIEDSIETYIFKVRSSYIKLFHLRKLRTKLSTIKDKLRSISERTQRYQIQFSNGDQGTNSLRNLRRSYPDDEEDDIIMLKDTMAALKAQLMALENRRCVVSVVGMGGLGKTTLAKKVYNGADVKKHFECCAWVFLSQQYVIKEVLSEILIQVGFQSDHPNRRNFEGQKYTKEFLEERKSKREFLNGLDDHELICLLKNELEEKRYLIVLDDIWHIDAWNRVQNAFPKGKLGSKVMFTTRIETIASSADPLSPPIRPPLLTTSESWELLKRKAIPRETLGEHGVPIELDELGKTMAEKCGGLPLAIIVLGGFLRTKINSVDEWVKVLKDVKSRMINQLKSTQQYRVEDILELRFQDLPYYLKPCFLYLGRFPEDSEIAKGRLIRLWIAEGFIPTVGKEEDGGRLIEDIAEQYLGELIDRCMVQVSRKGNTGKGVKTFRLHDLMRDFCISKAKEELFLEIVQSSEANQIATAARSRRIVVHMNHDLDGHKPWAGQVHSNLRSLLCSVPILSLKKENFLLLRVLELDFQYRDGACKLPSGIGNLIHLRHLKVCAFRELILPKSMGNLLLLQTLDLRGAIYVGAKLPRTMSRLRHLRHLLLPYFYSRQRWVMGALFGNDSLKKIVTLKGIKAKHLIRDNEVLPLSNIRVLEINDFTSDKEVTLVLNSLSFHSQLGSLQSLGMHFRYNREFPNLELLSHCHVLSKLSLEGQLSQENLRFLPKSLTKLQVSWCSCDQDKIAVLEKLPNLRILQWFGDYRNDEYKLVFSDGGFPKLEILRLGYFHNFVEWEVEEGAMPNLKRLDIEDIDQLRMIPEGLKHVTTLRELNVIYMPKEFAERLRASEGEDFYKVSHIPSVSISINTLRQ
ncbi:hypothetical protein TIFTF001_036625 [Ficus carica]|uniref:Uncharacterized protein n=1 Tax=Ficus carica TaxID=3494 RepID=A0AA88JCY5_FICCA|nr:hypothetical protein TIFTF001_036625 [Ficus carica]